MTSRFILWIVSHVQLTVFFCFFPTGYNPIFDESFEFQINLPELALVRFSVLDDDYIGDEFIGQYTIPFECMQTGKIQCLSQIYINKNFQFKNVNIFLPISFNICFECSKEPLIETVLLSTHNICFGWEIRKLNFLYALLTKVLVCFNFLLNFELQISLPDFVFCGFHQ